MHYVSCFSIMNKTLLKLSEEAHELYLPTTVRQLTSPPTPLEFLRQYVMPNIPAVIKNGVSHWPAIQKWSNEYLLEVLGKKVRSFYFFIKASVFSNSGFIVIFSIFCWRCWCGRSVALSGTHFRFFDVGFIIFQ